MYVHASGLLFRTVLLLLLLLLPKCLFLPLKKTQLSSFLPSFLSFSPNHPPHPFFRFLSIVCTHTYTHKHTSFIRTVPLLHGRETSRFLYTHARTHKHCQSKIGLIHSSTSPFNHFPFSRLLPLFYLFFPIFQSSILTLFSIFSSCLLISALYFIGVFLFECMCMHCMFCVFLTVVNSTTLFL